MIAGATLCFILIETVNSLNCDRNKYETIRMESLYLTVGF